MKRVVRWRLLACGFGAYALALVVTAPATLIDAALQGSGEGRLRLGEARGTLWSGAGQLELREAGGRSGIAISIAWRVLPASLLRGHLVCEVELDPATKRIPVTLSLSRVELADADINLPAAVLGLAVPKLAPLGLTGDVLIHVTSLAIARSVIEGSATLRWRAAASALTPVAPLGEYAMEFNAAGSAVRVALRTLKGPLQLDGEGSWASGGAPVFAAIARATPQYQQQLAPLLGMIAVARDEHSYTFHLN